MKSESLLVFIHKFQNTYIQLSNQYITDYIYKMILVIINVLFNENTANELVGLFLQGLKKRQPPIQMCHYHGIKIAQCHEKCHLTIYK